MIGSQQAGCHYSKLHYVTMDVNYFNQFQLISENCGVVATSVSYDMKWKDVSSFLSVLASSAPSLLSFAHSKHKRKNEGKGKVTELEHLFSRPGWGQRWCEVDNIYPGWPCAAYFTRRRRVRVIVWIFLLLLQWMLFNRSVPQGYFSSYLLRCRGIVLCGTLESLVRVNVDMACKHI